MVFEKRRNGVAEKRKGAAGEKRRVTRRKTVTAQEQSVGQPAEKAAEEPSGRGPGGRMAGAEAAAEKEESLEMVNLSDLKAYQADITFRDGSQISIPLVYESVEEAEKERASYTEYVRSQMSHSEPFPLYFGSMVIRGEDVRIFNFHESEPGEEHEKIGFTSRK